jgi:tRNA uridine 5-carboxymethylaminomethyl modification enzyme
MTNKQEFDYILDMTEYNNEIINKLRKDGFYNYKEGDDVMCYLDESKTQDRFKKECLEEAEIQIKYDSYIQKEYELADKLNRLENIKLPIDFDYHTIQSLSYECREKLNRYKPETLGQASRISGISPADINVLAIFLGR